jgi:Ni,Fe-hydrogenase maturation factor
MSDLASQFTDPLLPVVLGEVGKVEGVPIGKDLTREQLQKIDTALKRFTKAVSENGKKPHCIIVAGALGFRDDERTKSTEEDIRMDCLGHFRYPKTPPKDTVHVILDSGGGSLDSAFKTVIFLRRFAKKLHVYVPRSAKSAATLIALGADEVSMSPFAELGPLDTQIKDPRNPTKNVSALDCYQSVDYVQKFGLEAVTKILGVLLRETSARIPLSELVDTSTRFAAKEIVPMLGQVNAVDFGGWGRTLKIGETYAKALQLRLGHEDYEKTAERIATRLVYTYPHHPYPIDYEEAKDIGFNVTPMSERQYQASLDIAEACSESRCVGFTEDIQRMKLKATRRIERPLSAFEGPFMDGHRMDSDVAALAYHPGKASPTGKA